MLQTKAFWYTVPMKLLVCTQAVDSSDPILGFFHRWLVEFASLNERVTVICLREGKHDLPDNVTVLSLKSGNRFIRALLVLYYSALTQGDYNAVFVHMNPEYIDVAGWLWKLLNKRIILWYTHKSTPITLRFALPFVDSVVTASRESFRIDSPKVSIVGHGIDIERSIPDHIPSGEVRMITTGRISKVKGIDVMVDAFLELKRRGVACSFIAYGSPLSLSDEKYREGISTHLSEHGVDPKTVFVGSVSHAELPHRRAYADYLLHASETGSLDKNVLDACISGVIPISSSEAYVDLFADFEDLLIYPKGDSVALAERVTALESLPEAELDSIRRTLKDRVTKEHSLKALIIKIMRIARRECL